MPATPYPDCLIDEDGQPRLGYFDQPVADLGLDKFRYFNSMDKPAGALRRYVDFKQFQFISINTGHHIIGVAIADIRYLASGFCYVYDLASNTLVEQNWLRPARLGYQTMPSATEGQAYIGSGNNRLEFTISGGQWRLKIDTDNIQADVQLHGEEGELPLALCSPTGYQGWTYTQKHNCLSVEGRLSINNTIEDLSEALAGYDFSAGYMRRETNWCWASINNRLSCGRRFGLNLATGVNESGVSENCCWLDGQRHYLPSVQFTFKRQRGQALHLSDWQVRSNATNSEGRPIIELSFTPLNCRQERLNLWLLKSNFRQYIGHYNGVIETADGEKIIINNMLGLSEDHFARW
ncbi:hypothetical protein SIN8267_01134 [Sinobacterium norvegicum]|uniref:DUF2804 domain-containing protein n=2 Tax=Sinobacterium norvegicum TaxID=1641715 RepID=A0ABM9AEA4_9GAMM|nr:hypothetical protein SIN8267_01134 [Sinobacterium norvegicum]